MNIQLQKKIVLKVLSVKLMFYLPLQQTVITPFSSLINIKMKNGLTQQQAITELSQDLNITEDNLLRDYIENVAR